MLMEGLAKKECSPKWGRVSVIRSRTQEQQSQKTQVNLEEHASRRNEVGKWEEDAPKEDHLHHSHLRLVNE
jgi:hypothetical protein